MKLLKIFGHLLLFVLFTALTQIGGIIYLVSLLLVLLLPHHTFNKVVLVFPILYLITSFFIVPPIAEKSGRERIIEHTNVKCANPLFVLLNRNYVVPEMNSYIKAMSVQLGERNAEVTALHLDACFPFCDGFPLLPHLSHNDGRKVDFSLVYEDAQGSIVAKNKSISGYGVFEDPKDKEKNQPEVCLKAGYFQYDYPKYMTMGCINSDLTFSEQGTRDLLLALLDTPHLGKLFIEPHLKQRMQVSNAKVRYHGCGAVRHDDHIHIQIVK